MNVRAALRNDPTVKHDLALAGSGAGEVLDVTVALKILGLVGASYFVLEQFQLPGLFGVIGLWSLAMPWVLRALAQALRAEAIGALALFLASANADGVSALTADGDRVVAWIILALGVIYLALRRAEMLTVARVPIAQALGVLNSPLTKT